MEAIILLLVRLFAGVGVFLVSIHLLTTNLEQLATGAFSTSFAASRTITRQSRDRRGDHLTFVAHTEQDEKKHEEEP